MLSRFVRSPTSTPSEWADDPALIEDVRGLVTLRGSRGPHELIVGTQADGALSVVAHDRAQLSQRVAAQLAFHEVASGRKLTLDVAELYVFDLQVLELLMDAPGLNDAMYLYGALRGPYPATPGQPVATIEGQLTVTRSDLLSALVDGTQEAFAYRPEGHGSRCVHALLPGERAEIIDGGQGAVLAFPLAPAYTLDSLVPNDRVAGQIFYDVIHALYRDLGEALELGVPSRAVVAAELQAEGFTIEGDTAVRTKRTGILGALMPEREKRTLPREGTLDEYVRAAGAALARLGVPTPETLALRRRRGAVTPATAASRPIPMSTTPLPPTAPASSTTTDRQPRPRVEAGATDWMKDFVDAHRAPGRPAPRVVAPARAVAPKKQAPAWMDDFAEPGKKKPSE
jgi:hypothetical protein